MNKHSYMSRERGKTGKLVIKSNISRMRPFMMMKVSFTPIKLESHLMNL